MTVASPSSPYYSPHTKVILLSPPPINTYQRGAELTARDPPQALDRSFETTKAYADKVSQVGSSLSIPVVDVWNALYDAAHQEEKALSKFMDDGLHLNGQGYEVNSHGSSENLCHIFLDPDCVRSSCEHHCRALSPASF